MKKFLGVAAAPVVPVRAAVTAASQKMREKDGAAKAEGRKRSTTLWAKRRGESSSESKLRATTVSPVLGNQIINMKRQTLPKKASNFTRNSSRVKQSAEDEGSDQKAEKQLQTKIAIQAKSAS